MVEVICQFVISQKNRENPNLTFNGLFLGGQVIKQLRTDFDVNIQLPKKSDTNDDSTIIITGYEKNANQARDAILKIINEFVSINLICCIILKTI